MFLVFYSKQLGGLSGVSLAMLCTCNTASTNFWYKASVIQGILAMSKLPSIPEGTVGVLIPHAFLMEMPTRTWEQVVMPVAHMKFELRAY